MKLTTRVQGQNFNIPVSDPGCQLLAPNLTVRVSESWECAAFLPGLFLLPIAGSVVSVVAIDFPLDVGDVIGAVKPCVKE